MKARKLNGAFWCCLKWCFGSWNCLENFENKEAKWCIQTLFERMWSTTFRGAIECGNMLITEITLNKTMQYKVKLLVSRCFVITYNIHFLNTPVYFTYSLNCISVLLCTQWIYFVLVVVMGITSLADFQSTSLFSK